MCRPDDSGTMQCTRGSNQVSGVHYIAIIVNVAISSDSHPIASHLANKCVCRWNSRYDDEVVGMIGWLFQSTPCCSHKLSEVLYWNFAFKIILCSLCKKKSSTKHFVERKTKYFELLNTFMTNETEQLGDCGMEFSWNSEYTYMFRKPRLLIFLLPFSWRKLPI